MSRFWAQESSSDDDQSSDSDSHEEDAPIVRQADKKFGSTFEESDSDSDDEVRVVRSEKDRKWDSIKEGILKMRNARKNNDWPLIQDEFANVNKLIDKSKMLIIQNGLPKFYIKMLMEVEDHVQTALKDKESIKKMKPVVERALNLMKLQVRKHNLNYKDEIADCRTNPDKYQEVEVKESDDEDEDESEEESEEESEDEKPKAKPTKKVTVAADSDEDSLFGGKDDDDESSDESEESDDDGRPELKGRARWLKKVEDPIKKKEREEKQKIKDKEKAATALLKAKNRKDSSISNNISTATTKRVISSWELEEKLSEEELDKRVNDLMSTRGRKNTDIRDVLRQLEVLTKASRIHGAKKEIPLLMHLISAMFESHRSIDDYMDLHQWRTCYRSLNRVLTLLASNSSYVLGILGSDEVSDLSLNIHMKKQGDDANTTSANNAIELKSNSSLIKVLGSVESFIIRLQDEYTKSLQQINPHTKEYVTRLSDEASLMELGEKVLDYYLRVNDMKAFASVALLIVEHMYYKHSSHALSVRQAHVFNKVWGNKSDLHPACASKNSISYANNLKAVSVEKIHPGSYLGTPTVNLPPFSPEKRLQELCSYVFKHGEKRMKTQALLALVHHYALHDNFYKARDLLLTSRIQDFIDKADIRTQILYNRAIVVLGLCAFRLGLYQKAHDCLSGICSGKVKELLAQGQNKWTEKDPEQEKIERRRQLPYHMHINPDLIEMCNLTSAMILELPQLARNTLGTPTPHQNIISRQFRKYFAGYNKLVFCGPPENTREHVLAAAKALLSGEWNKAIDYLLNLEVWKLIPEGIETAKKILEGRIKEEAVRTFLLLNTDHYDSLNLNYICDMFVMEEITARKIISRMIFNREISAAWEQPANILVIYKTEPSVLQALSHGITEKISILLESNERILDPLINVYGFANTTQDWIGQKGGNINKTSHYTGNDKRFRQYKNTGNKPTLMKQSYQNKRDGKSTSSNRNMSKKYNTSSTSNDKTKKYSSDQTTQPKKWATNV